MELTELSSKHKNIILSLALVLLSLVIALNIYKQQAKDTELLKARIDEEKKKNTVLESLGLLEKRINTYKSLFANKDESSVINNIGNFARESAIKVISIRQVLEKRNPEYIEFPFNLVLSTSNYHALGQFVSKLENSKDFYVVDSLNIRLETITKELIANLRLNYIIFTNL